MNILVQLSHPAHFHYYRYAIDNWRNDGHTVIVAIKTKDVLEDLVKRAGIPYVNINPHPHRKNRVGIIWDMLLRDWRLFWICIKHRIDVLTGSSAEIAHIGWLLRRASIGTGEDDAPVVSAYMKLASPFLDVRLAPVSCNNGAMEPKTIKYKSFHELAYLHPNQFIPNPDKVAQYGFSPEEPFFLLRFASLRAYHDTGVQGIDNAIAHRLIEMLLPHGRVFITSERPLDASLEAYRIAIDPLDIHHVMAFASLFIGDSQTMAAEAAVLGIPFVRFNDFVGRIGYLNELENDYQLGYGIRASEADATTRLFERVEELLSMPNRKEVWQSRRQTMLSEKIDYAQFLTWFIEDYPESRDIMKSDPDYQFRFR